MIESLEIGGKYEIPISDEKVLAVYVGCENVRVDGNQKELLSFIELGKERRGHRFHLPLSEEEQKKLLENAKSLGEIDKEELLWLESRTYRKFSDG